MFSKYFIFENPKDIDYSLFRKLSLQHNREIGTKIAIGAFFLFILVHIIWNVFDLDRESTQISYFNINVRVLVIVSFIVTIYHFLVKFKKIKENEKLSQFITILFAITLLGVTCVNSFVFTFNPKNNLTPILIGAIATSALFRFNVLESMFVFIMGLLFFASLFIFWPDTQIRFALNFIVVFNIYVLAFLINRTIFTNAYHYFQQLRLIESINFSLKNSVKQKDEVLEIVAHDLRGPVANIKELIVFIEESDHSRVENEKIIQMIKESCNNAEDVIKDLLSIAKIKYVDEPIETVCLNDILLEITNNVIKNNPDRHIYFHQKPNKIYAEIYTDKLKRIIFNLLSNSLKFTPDDKKIEVDFYETNTKNIIEIKDEGIGVDKDYIDQLFKKFSKASKTGLHGEESVGLGLFIVKELTELMNGQIEFIPNKFTGSVFRISFPRK